MLENLVNYLKEVKMEIGKISWPSREKVITDTQVVIVLSVILGVYLTLLDFGVSEAFKWLINIDF